MIKINQNQRKVIILTLSIFVIFFFSTYALAVDMNELNRELDRQEQANTQSQNLFLEFIKLIIVLSLIIGAAWSLIRLFAKQVNAKMQGTWLNIVDEVALGQNRGIVLCEVGGKLYAIGVTDNNINLLFEIDNSNLIDEISESKVEDLYSDKSDDIISKITKKINQLMGINNFSTKPRKDFHSLMENQTKRLQMINNNDLDDRGSRRNSDDK